MGVGSYWKEAKSIDEIADWGWGHSDTYLTDEDIEKLKNGAILGRFDGEYTTSIQYKPKS